MCDIIDNEKARREELGPTLPAIQRYSIGFHSDEWGVISPTAIYDDAGKWMRYEDHTAVITALRAQQPSPAPSLNAWQPIETAPKDGEAVILTEGGKVFHGGFITIDFKEIRDSEGNFIDQIDPDEYWMNFDEGDVCTPTHWMPKRSLPMPPDAAKWGTPAPAVQEPVVQDDLITIRKPTTSAEMFWLLKLAHLVISDVNKTLEETFAPAQELRESFTAADMATAASQGFRDGVASVANQPAPDEIINMAREQGLPETEIEGVFRVNADDLCRVHAAAILAARRQGDKP